MHRASLICDVCSPYEARCKTTQANISGAFILPNFRCFKGDLFITVFKFSNTRPFYIELFPIFTVISIPSLSRTVFPLHLCKRVTVLPPGTLKLQVNLTLKIFFLIIVVYVEGMIVNTYIERCVEGA